MSEQPKSQLDASLIKLVRKPYLTVVPPNDKILAFWKSQKKYKCLIGGNRSGKTENVALDVIWHLLGEHPFYEVKAPQYWRAHVVDYKQLRKVVIEKFLKYIPDDAVKGGWEGGWEKRQAMLFLKNGSIIDFTTHKTSLHSLEGASLDGVWIDEECPREQFRALLYRTIDRKGKVFVSATPIHGLSWLKEEFIDKAETNDDFYVDFVSTYENKYLDEEAIKAIENTASVEEREIRLYGKIQNYSRLIFPTFENRHIIYDLPFPPKDRVFFVGFDWGYAHNSALVYVVKIQDTFYVLDEWVGKQTTIDGIGRLIQLWHDEYDIPPNNIVVVYDSSLGTIDTYGKRPINRLLFRKIAATKNASATIELINQLFEADRLFISDKCRKLINALKNAYFVNGKMQETEEKDIVDAFRYGVYRLATGGDWFLDIEEEEEDTGGSAVAKIYDAIERRRRPKVSSYL